MKNCVGLFTVGLNVLWKKKLLGGDDSHEVVHSISRNAEGTCTGGGYGLKGDFSHQHNN